MKQMSKMEMKSKAPADILKEFCHVFDEECVQGNNHYQNWYYDKIKKAITQQKKNWVSSNTTWIFGMRLDGYDHSTRGLKSGAPNEFPLTDDLGDTLHYNVKIEE